MLADLRYAWRGLAANPIFAATALVTLALGIGGNTAMFTVIRAVLLKPLSYPNPDQLVSITGGATPARFDHLRDTATSLTGIASFSGIEDLTLTGGASPEVLKGARISANSLSILQIQPIAGRSFEASEDTPKGAPVALISEKLWDRRFHRDPQVIGKPITLSETAYSIVGIVPAHLQFPFPDLDIWLTRPQEWPLMAPKSRALSPFLTLFGRLKPGVSLQAANAELALTRHRYAAEHPSALDAKSKTPTELTPMKDQLVNRVRVMLWMLFGAVGFVLLITCANVASLMLARSHARTREFAVRAAVGAPASRLLSQMLAESLLLSLAGGLAGILIAAWTLRAIPLLTGFELPRTSEIRLDWAVLSFALTLSVLTGILFGLAPAFTASRPDLIVTLRGAGSAATTKTRFNIRAFLVVAQVAFSVILLVGAALMLESIVNMRDIRVGFNPDHLLTSQVTLPPLKYDTDQRKASFAQTLLSHILAEPGITSASASMTVPMSGYAGSPVQPASAAPLPLNERPIATINVITPDYFQTLGVPLRRGRDFTFEDNSTSERVAIIDESLARRFWPQYPAGPDPVNQQLTIGYSNPKPARIVGIVANVHQTLEATEWPDTLYVSFMQSPQVSMLLSARGNQNALIAPAVRRALQALDHDLPLSQVKLMQDLVDSELGERRVVVTLLAVFAGVSLLLALVGIYGVIAYSVTQRIQEIAVRAALGAQKADILRLLLTQAFVLAGVGIAFGLAAAFWLTKFLAQLLFGIAATDPATFAAIALLFFSAALLASFIPARRGARIDPMQALRV